jgi:hypothetical protein
MILSPFAGLAGVVVAMPDGIKLWHNPAIERFLAGKE